MQNYYTPIGGLGLHNLGTAANMASRPGMGIEPLEDPGPFGAGRVGYLIWSALSLTGASTGAYHGYKRNNGSVGWAIGWFFLGGLFPVITIPVSLAQGYGKSRVSTNRRRRRTSRRTRRTSRRQR